MTSRDDIVATARQWLDVPWRHKGRNEHGVDCVGLLVVVYRALGLMQYDFLDYDRDPDGAKFLVHFDRAGGIRINPGEAGDGDALVFRQSKFPMHAGIRATRLGAASVIHAHMLRRRVIEDIIPREAPLLAAYRLPDVIV